MYLELNIDKIDILLIRVKKGIRAVHNICILPIAISYGNSGKKIQHKISLFFKGVYIINCGTGKKLYPLFSGRVKGRGKGGVYYNKLRDWKEIVSPLFRSREGEGEKGGDCFEHGKKK